MDWGAATATSNSGTEANSSSSSSSSFYESAGASGNGKNTLSSSSSSSKSTGTAVQEGSGSGISTIFVDQLEKAGFRGDRLSVWAVQGLRDQGLSIPQLQELFAELTNSAAFHSLLVGELPGPMSRQQAENLLAEMGLLGAVQLHAAADAGSYGRLRDREENMELPGDTAALGQDGWLFTAQQLRLSLQQMGVYEEHVAAAEAADEDFFGHFS
jgi:hypothetical protein